MPRTTIASLEARVIALEALVATSVGSLTSPKPQAPTAPRLALRPEQAAVNAKTTPKVTYFTTRDGVQMMRTRVGNTTWTKPAPLGAESSEDSQRDEVNYTPDGDAPEFPHGEFPHFEVYDTPDRDLGWN